MKKWIRNVITAIVLMAIICMAFWKIEWISSWKEVAILYVIIAIVIVISIITDTIKKKFNK